MAAQIARKFVGDKPDAIVAIATPSAQAVIASTKTVPVVLSAVTDPVAAAGRQLEPSKNNVNMFPTCWPWTSRWIWSL